MVANQGGGTPRWRRLPESRRDAIIAAALDVFGAEGVEAARMDQIATQAGLSKGSIYRYFPDKTQLFADSVADTLTTLLDPFSRRILREPDNFLLAAWRVLNDPRFQTVYRLAGGQRSRFAQLRDNISSGLERNLVKPLAAIFGQTVRESPIEPDDALQLARVAIATLLGVALQGGDTANPISPTIAFVLRACDLNSPASQADGF